MSVEDTYLTDRAQHLLRKKHAAPESMWFYGNAPGMVLFRVPELDRATPAPGSFRSCRHGFFRRAPQGIMVAAPRNRAT
jgi:hypothetical protein